MAEVIETLLVEDNPSDGALLECLLAGVESLDVRVDHVARLEDGVSRATQHTYKLILTDLTLPDSVGYQTFERMVVAAPDVPIIVMSGVEDSTLSAAAIKKGVQDYIVKGSIDSAGLERAIRSARERKQTEIESRRVK